MKLNKRQYPSKLLLFGEYGILLGLDALAVAYPGFSGKLMKTDAHPDDNLLNLLKYLKKIVRDFPYDLNIKELELDVKMGLRFSSDIPLNYGLGSSGALVAAIFENYINKKSLDSIKDPRALKMSLALIESHFHGISSGIDPLVSLIKKPVLVQRSGKVYLLDKPIIRKRKKLHFFLIDSNQPGKTGEMVSDFMEKMNDPEFSETFRSGYKKYSNGAIRHLINRRYNEFYERFTDLSAFQLKHMKELIPEHIQPLFANGSETNDYALKICGSGGGGYYLGITRSKEVLEQFNKKDLIIL